MPTAYGQAIRLSTQIERREPFAASALTPNRYLSPCKCEGVPIRRNQARLPERDFRNEFSIFIQCHRGVGPLGRLLARESIASQSTLPGHVRELENLSPSLARG